MAESAQHCSPLATIDLNLLRAFVAVAETSSFSAAATRLGVPKSSVSRGIKKLEEHLGVTLVHRTTRSVSLSTAGEGVYARVAPRLVDLEGVLGDLPELEEQPSGDLRVTASVDFGAVVLADIVARFIARYPAVRVDLHLTNDVVDLVHDGFDLAFRASQRPLKSSALHGRRVARLTMGLFAAPTYLARRGVPRSPDDLDDHEWVLFARQPRVVLTGPGPEVTLTPLGRITGDDMSFLREAVRAGGGVGVLPTFLVDADVAAGALVRLLPRWSMPSGDLWMVHPAPQPGAGVGLPKKLVALRAFVVEALAARAFG